MEIELKIAEGSIGARIILDDDDGSKGIRVKSVLPGGNGENGGLKENDLIVSLNGISTKGMHLQDFVTILKKESIKEKRLVVYRDELAMGNVTNVIRMNDQNNDMNKSTPPDSYDVHLYNPSKQADKSLTNVHANELEKVPENNVEQNETDQRNKRKAPSSETLNMKKQKSKESSAARCDICTKPDNIHNTCLQTCSSCGVSVHETCYGLINLYENSKYKAWTCHACASVGKTVTVKIAKGDSVDIQKIKIIQRPTKCALCSVSNGFHAMHPLFNKHGSEGRPVIRKVNGLYQIVWVHTLCALVLATNQFSCGLVYGCNADGDYEADTTNQSSTDEAEEPTGDPHIDFDYVENDEKVLIASPHHFVITYANDNGIDYLGRIRDFRKLTCYICKIKPKDQRRRIPTQCSHGDCLTAFHIGCARWGTDFNRVLFSPVETVETGNHIAEGYCRKHFKKTKNLIKGNTEEASEEEEMEDADFQNDDSSDYSSESEQHISNFLDDDDAVDEYQESSTKSKKDKTKKKSSATKNTSEEQSEYMERKLNLQKAFREVEQAKKKKEKRRLLLFWRERLRAKDFDKLKNHFDRIILTSTSASTVKEGHPNTQTVNLPNTFQITPSIWDKMFVPNYVRGSINFDEWDEYQEISESDM